MSNEVYFRVKVTTINAEEFVFYVTSLNELEEKIEVNKIKKSEITTIHMSKIIPELVKQPVIKPKKKESIIQQWSRIIDPKE